MRRAWLVVVGILLVCCGITYVKGPDGNSDWFKVECRREAMCMKKAAKQCPKGFLLAESQTGTSTFYKKAPEGEDDDSIGNLREMFARCGEEKEETRREEDDEPFKPIAKPKNLAACGRAYDKIEDLVAGWAEWHPTAEALEKQPTRSEFINVCGDLPETVQNCLNVRYTKAHMQECGAELDNLPQKLRVRLAKLFEKDGNNPADFAVPAPPVVDSGVPADAGVADAGKVKDAGAPPKPKPGAKPVPDAGKPADASVTDATVSPKDATLSD